MWMMGCRDSAGLQTSDSFSGKKLRPLIPRPTTLSSSSSTTSVTATTTCFSRIHSNDLFALHNHLGAVEQGKRDACNHPVSSRWNPTPEQLHTLEELYRRGTRTPSAEQIQHITAQLRRYGKIEGKNVFYWFQNHKARERQKRRRQIEAAMALERDAVMESKDSAAMSRTEGCKNWSHPTNCSILAEESTLFSKAEATMEGGRSQFDRELNHQSSAVRNATWHFHLSSLPDYITTNPVATTTAATVTTTRVPTLVDEGCNVVAGDEFRQSQTLELFPLRSNGVFLPEKPAPSSMPVAPTTTTANFSPYQFFHFL